MDLPFGDIDWHVTVLHYMITPYDTETVRTSDNGPMQAIDAKVKATQCTTIYYDCGTQQIACLGVLWTTTYVLEVHLYSDVSEKQ